jgi:hypothetical protein
VTIQVDPDAVCPDDQAVAGADQIVIEPQVLRDRRAAQVVRRRTAACRYQTGDQK